VQTEVELEGGQSFVIAGLLDQRMTETLNKIPGLSAIPLLGKLFQSKSAGRNNTELMVIVTPEIVRPIPADQKVPELHYPQPFMSSNSETTMRTPGIDKTGPAPAKPQGTMPLEELIQQRKEGQPAPPPTTPYFVMPVQGEPQPAGPAPGAAPPTKAGGAAR
jgi:pilus assembly protein CpaC